MILDRYIGRSLAANSLMALFVLGAIFSFFSLVDQLNDAGAGNYGVIEALQYVALTMPRLAIGLLPIAVVIGSMVTLGAFANSNELTIIRMSGVSKNRLALALLKTGLIIVLAGFFFGEFIVPVSEQKAMSLRSIAQTSHIPMNTRHGFWSRDGNSFINIKSILPGNRLTGITIYEFDDNRILVTVIKAKDGRYINDKWVLNDVYKTDINATGITQTRFQQAEWNVSLNPEVIEMATIRPRYLSLYELASYIQYLRANHQNSVLYKQAFWSKFVGPFSSLVMMLFAICVVRCEGQTVSIGWRVFIGAMLGIFFHLLNQVSSHIGTVYGINAFTSASAPTLLAAAYVFYAIRKQP